MLKLRWRRESQDQEKEVKIKNPFSKTDFREFVEEYCHNAKHRPILIDRYCDGMTFAELGDRYNYPERSIKKIVYRYDNIIIKFAETLERE